MAMLAIGAATVTAISPEAGAFLVGVGVCAIALATARVQRFRRRPHVPAVLASALSLATTLVWLIVDADRGMGWMMLEFLGLDALILLVLRVVDPSDRIRLGALLIVAQLLVALRQVTAVRMTELLALYVFVLCSILASAAGGLYLRSLDERRLQAMREARRGERLELTRALHDYLAHDITGIVVRSQAALQVAAVNPAESLVALAHIERAGRSALETLDRTMATLQAGSVDEATPYVHPGIEALDGLVERFRETDGVATDVDVSFDTNLLSPERSALVYRLAVEALTNVRRHAANVTSVSLQLRVKDGTLGVRIRNNGDASPSPSVHRHGGFGLMDLADEVRAHSGTFTAGPVPSGGWELSVDLPLGADNER